MIKSENCYKTILTSPRKMCAICCAEKLQQSIWHEPLCTDSPGGPHLNTVYMLMAQGAGGGRSSEDSKDATSQTNN